MALGTEVGLGPGDIVRWGSSKLLKKGAQHPHFSAHAYFGKTAGWIKMPLGMEADLGPDHIVLVGDPVPPPATKGVQQPPLFGPCLLWPNGHPSQLLLS